MLATAFALLAFTTSANTAAVAVQTDYSKAYAMAVEQHKPLAVFIGTAQPTLDDSAAKLLRENYVVVFIDATTKPAAAASFEMTQGLVISDKTGSKQALRLSGPVSTSDLNESLVKFANGDTPATTMTTLHPAPVYVAPAMGGCASGRCPNAR